jgi:Sugar (and other) transporter
VTLNGFFVFFGICIAYWVDYACLQTISSDGHNQWRVPVAIQVAPSVILIVGMIPMRESSRWLARQGRHEQALRNLAYIRHESIPSQETEDEYFTIKESIELELLETEGVRLKELWLPRNRMRVLLGFAMMVAQQLTGTVVFTYVSEIAVPFRLVKVNPLMRDSTLLSSLLQ